MSSTQPQAAAPEPDDMQPAASPGRVSILESVLDNLSAWTVVAAAITLLYLVWATIDVLNVHAGDLPSMVP